MIYAAAALLAIAAPQSSQSSVVWKWDPVAACGLRQQLDGGGSLLIAWMPTSDPTISLQDLKSVVSAWQLLNSVELTFEAGVKVVADGSIGPGDHRRSRSIAVHSSDPNLLDQLSRASNIGFSHTKFGEVRVPIRSAAAAVRAVRACEEKTMREWGIDPVQYASLQSRPIPISQPYTWISEWDYPQLAALFGVGGLVAAKMDVGPDGTIKTCTVVNRKALPDFHRAACRALTKRGRFKPAIDATGKPVPAPFVVQIRPQMAR